MADSYTLLHFFNIWCNIWIRKLHQSRTSGLKLCSTLLLFNNHWSFPPLDEPWNSRCRNDSFCHPSALHKHHFYCHVFENMFQEGCKCRNIKSTLQLKHNNRQTHNIDESAWCNTVCFGFCSPRMSLNVTCNSRRNCSLENLNVKENKNILRICLTCVLCLKAGWEISENGCYLKKWSPATFGAELQHLLFISYPISLQATCRFLQVLDCFLFISFCILYIIAGMNFSFLDLFPNAVRIIYFH